MTQLEEFKVKINKPLRQTTLMFLIKGEKVLLAMKKKGFGYGRWNGVGGKPIGGEKIRETAIRETTEEIGLKPLEFKEVATLDFYFRDTPIEQDWNQQVIVFICTRWEGNPAESDEMRPDWFEITDMPFDQMWSADPLWLPKVLIGQGVVAEFLFDKDQQVADYSVRNLIEPASNLIATPNNEN